VTSRRRYSDKQRAIGDPTRLILVDEADRLKVASLVQMRSIFDAGGVCIVLIGMPEIGVFRFKNSKRNSTNSGL
jgi:DNA transposition AAA+ family ATPase